MDSLAKVFADCMMRSAIKYCDQQKVAINAEHLSQCLKIMSPRIKGALADAKEAIDANMPQVAEATFRASAVIAGIDAAKEYIKETTHATCTAEVAEFIDPQGTLQRAGLLTVKAA